MTTLNYILMFIGFGCWFYAGYTYGGTKVRIKKRKYENRQATPPRFPKLENKPKRERLIK